MAYETTGAAFNLSFEILILTYHRNPDTPHTSQMAAKESACQTYQHYLAIHVEPKLDDHLAFPKLWLKINKYE